MMVTNPPLMLHKEGVAHHTSDVRMHAMLGNYYTATNNLTPATDF
jgi:hypothetical protein